MKDASVAARTSQVSIENSTQVSTTKQQEGKKKKQREVTIINSSQARYRNITPSQFTIHEAESAC